jgi:hypothetical protein
MEDNQAGARNRAYPRLLTVAAVAFLFTLYFFRSFALYVDIINPVGMEECHTGAIAREILANGFDLPIEQYTPEYYENSIVAAGILTIVPVWIMGLSRLSVEMTPFVLSFAAFMVFCALLRRAGLGSGIWFFIVSYYFSSISFVIHTMDSVGSHILGIFIGSFIIWQFYESRVSKKNINFYMMMFAIGLGLFLNMASLMFAALCFLAYIFYRPVSGEKQRASVPTLIKGAAAFLIGAAPFAFFMIKTKMMSATYLFGVFGRRSSSFGDWNSFINNTVDYMLYQFDGKPWLAALLFVPVLILWVGWLAGWGKTVSESKKLLLYLICFFPAPVFGAVVVFSGGEFTTYHIYLLPLLFMAGAALSSIVIDCVFKNPVSSTFAQFALSMALIAVFLSGEQFKNLNFSVARAVKVLTADEEEAFCYWRFGRAFGNHTEFKGDTAVYAKDMVAACGRFDEDQKTNECLWGWSAEATHGGFMLDAKAALALGSDRASLIARSKGGWASSILKCFEVHEAFVGDCFRGIAERKAIKIYSVRRAGDPYIRLPCLSEEREFSGLVEWNMEKLREPGGSTPQECPDSLNMLCVIADAYCAAIEGEMDFCLKGYDRAEDAKLCSFIYEHTLISESAKKRLFASETHSRNGI